MAKDLKSPQNVVERETMEQTETPEENLEETQEEKKEEEGTEETQPESSTEETSEENVEEKETELDVLKKELDKAKGESQHIKEAMQKRIDELTWQIKSFKEQQDSSKEKTWDDLDSKELTKYIAHYANEGNGEMVAFLTDKLTDKKIEASQSKSSKMAENNAIRAKTWSEVTQSYPELNNPESEHYQRTLELVRSDKRFEDINNYPEGHAVAARLVAEQMLNEKIRNMEGDKKVVSKKTRDEALKNSLDTSSGKVAPSTSRSDLDKLWKQAEDSGNPYGAEWKQLLRKVNAANK